MACALHATCIKARLISKPLTIKRFSYNAYVFGSVVQMRNATQRLLTDFTNKTQTLKGTSCSRAFVKKQFCLMASHFSSLSKISVLFFTCCSAACINLANLHLDSRAASENSFFVIVHESFNVRYNLAHVLLQYILDTFCYLILRKKYVSFVVCTLVCTTNNKSITVFKNAFN